VTVHRARRAGDGDNFLKAAKDALNGVCWPDDRMVVTALVRILDGLEPGILVRVTRLQEAAA
jgi:Holliday junction resolvase RusA-like endonuclease